MPGWPAKLDADTVIDISHESLIRQWQTLRDWVQREARSATLYQRLRQTAQLWPQDAALWRNPDLEGALLWERDEAPSAAWAARYGTREEFARAVEAAEHELELRTQREREARLQAEVRELQSRKRLLSAVLVLVPALLGGLGWALFNRSDAIKQAELAKSETERAKVQELAAKNAAETARVEARKAQEARDQSVLLLERLTNTNRLKQAFLEGDVATIQSIARATPPDPGLRFAASSTAVGWKTPDGKPVYRYELFPSPESLKGPLKAATQISYYMNHPTFTTKLLSAGGGTGFTASYTGWGCLSNVYVLIEYADPDTPPKLTQYNQCAAIP
jgi:hypothetical protein